MKVGDRISKEDFAYFIVETEQKPNKKGNTIIVKKRDIQPRKEGQLGEYTQSFIDFLNNNCRVANTLESDKMYEDEFSNAVVGETYDDGSYNIYYYFVPTTDLNILSVFNGQGYYEYFERKVAFFKNIGIDNYCSFELDEKGKFIYCTIFETSYKKLLDNFRKATPEETKKFNEEVVESNRVKKEKIKQEEAEKKEARQEHYERNKNNSEYFPGSCGNYKQVVISENGLIDETKLYDLYTIKQFYKELINSGKIDKRILEQIILYGGTVPYVLLDTKEETRKFGDVDIFIPIENMAIFRQIIMDKSYFNMTFDSMDLTGKAGLKIAGCKSFEQPLFMGDGSDIEAYNEYLKRISILEKEYEKKIIYQDYGFKGNLFGVNISVFPIYQWNKNNELDICAKSFRIGKEIGSNRFLLNTVVTHDTPINSFSKLVELYGGVIGIANLEYTIASKKSAINHGYLLRQDTDLRDLEFMEQNRYKFGIDDNLIRHYEKSIPDYGISKVYRITRTYKVEKYTPEEYKHIVTRSHKPS